MSPDISPSERNHAEEALDLLKQANGVNGWPLKERDSLIRAAQVHATLALVERVEWVAAALAKANQLNNS